MVPMPKIACWQPFPLRVVIAVWCGDDHRTGTCELEDHALRRTQAGRVQVLDHFHQCRRVKAFQAFVTIQQRSLHETQPGALGFGEAVVVQSPRGDLERRRGNVHAEDARECPLGLQPTLTTAEVQHARRTTGPQHCQHGGQALLVEAERLFDRFLLAVAPFARGFGIIGRVRFLLDG